MRRLLILIFSVGVFLIWNVPESCPASTVLDNFFLARAQGQAGAVLYPVDASDFPAISSFMDVFDASGRFVSGILPEQVTILEDEQPVPPDSVTEMVVPLQLAVAINPGPALGVRDDLGKERFAGLVEALSMWAQALPADTPDDMSLVTLSGPIISHASARDWQVSLQAFRPEFHETLPNLQTLQIAIETVAVQPPRVGMKRAVLFITPHMDDPDIESRIVPLIERASQNGVRVFVWFTDSELYAATASATAFSTLALQTGGAYYAATELQPYPDPETYFAPLRRVYALQYQSPATSSGDHSVRVEVVGQAGVVRTEGKTFTLDVQPPNPIFVSPPLQILRSPPEDDPFNPEILMPVTQTIEAIIEFPDGHPRPLEHTALYVDGEAVAQNTAEPFDLFTWDLGPYTATAEHRLAIEAVDTWGLSKTSIEIPVTMTVTQPPRGIEGFFAQYRDIIIIVAVAAAGAVLFLIIFLGRLRHLFSRARAGRSAQLDPLTQPVGTAATPSTGTLSKSKARQPSAAVKVAKRTLLQAPAMLRPMLPDPLAAPGDTFRPASTAPIALTARECTFGTDPDQATQVLDDASLEARHARITRTDKGDFFVVDAGTIGGTWVNFEPVGQEARLLHHGDLVHFGQLVFRFELRDPPEETEPSVHRLTRKE